MGNAFFIALDLMGLTGGRRQLRKNRGQNEMDSKRPWDSKNLTGTGPVLNVSWRKGSLSGGATTEVTSQEN